MNCEQFYNESIHTKLLEKERERIKKLERMSSFRRGGGEISQANEQSQQFWLRISSLF